MTLCDQCKKPLPSHKYFTGIEMKWMREGRVLSGPGVHFDDLCDECLTDMQHVVAQAAVDWRKS